MRVVARRSTCEGNSLCMLAVPDRFILDAESKVVVEVEEIAEDDYESVVEAVRACPTQSLRIDGFA
ncbi:MAG TPA: ferredoxin [Jatrophihabitantaceae bacterium]|jgi:ferredoxin